MYMKENFRNRVLAVFLSALLILGMLPVTAFAADFTVEGSFVIHTEDEDCYQVQDGTVTLKDGANVTLSGDGSKYTILVPENVKNVTITLDGYTGNRDKEDWFKNAVELQSGASATLVLADGTVNSLQGGREASAIRVPQGASLTIMGNGTLNASINNSGSAAYCAVIGSQYTLPYGDIRILGGTINITGSQEGRNAAIGTASWQDKEGTDNGMILIENATVNCGGGNIGGAGNASGNRVILRDATVNDGKLMAGAIVEEENSMTIQGDFELKEDYQLDPGKTLTIPEGSSLIVAPGVTFTNKGQIVNNGNIYNNGTVTGVDGTVHSKPYLEVENGSFSGDVKAGETITITADSPEEGYMFSQWTVKIGNNVQVLDASQVTTRFTMPDACVVIQAEYTKAVASVAAPDGTVTYYEDLYDARDQWEEIGGKLTLLQETDEIFPPVSLLPEGSVLDLGGFSVLFMEFPWRGTLLIENGNLRVIHHAPRIEVGVTIGLKDVILSGEMPDTVLENNGILLDLGGVDVEPSIRIEGFPIEDGCYYLDEKGQIHMVTENYRQVGSSTLSWSDGWYVVREDVTLEDRVSVSGDVKLILEDGVTLTAREGISVTEGNSLTIYAQSSGENMGSLVASSTSWSNAAIGGDEVQRSNGSVTINGGKISATSAVNSSGAGIGGGYFGNGGTITINGGIVNAQSGSGGAGIGGGADSGNGTFATGADGNAVIFASSIGDQSGKTDGTWNGIIFEGTEGAVYGTVELEENLEIPQGYTLTILEGASLTLPEGVSLTNNGTVNILGTFINNGVVICNHHSSGTATCTEEAKCSLCGAPYGEALGHTLVKVEAKDPTVSAEGNIEYWHCEDCGKYFLDAQGTDEITLEETVLPKLPSIIQGADAAWEKGSQEGLTVTSNGAFADFVKVLVDGKELAAENYEAKEGSTIVTLKPSYLETLAEGRHTLSLVFQNGTAETAFTVKNAVSSEDDESAGSPGTGESGTPWLWVALLLRTGAGLAGTAAYTMGKKKEYHH